MYCKNCGSAVDDHEIKCPNCGYTLQQADDEGGFGWGLLGCCVPIAGLILFLVWHDTKPNSAKAAGIGALIAAGCSILYVIIVVVAGIGLGLSVLGLLT